VVEFKIDSLDNGAATVKKTLWTELRNDLNAVARQLAASESGTSAREVVEKFHKDRAELIRAASEFLIDTALTRLVGDVIKRRADKDIDIEQPELFEQMISDIIAISNSANGAGRRDRLSGGRKPANRTCRTSGETSS